MPTLPPEDIPIKEYLDARIADLEKYLLAQIKAVDSRHDTARQAEKEAVDKAEAATERRLEGLNELRAMVSDYQRDLLPRSEADTVFRNKQEKIDALAERISRLEDIRTQQTGRQTGLAAGWAYLIAAIGIIGVIVSVVMSLLG